MENIELAVKASKWNDAVAILAEVDIHEKVRSRIREVEGIFVVAVNQPKSLTTKQYALIFNSPNIAILSDTASHKRAVEMCEDIYSIEVKLRSHLIYISDAFDSYFDMFSRTFKRAKKTASEGSITRREDLDPLTSHAEFDEIIQFMSLDTSKSKDAISYNDLGLLLKESTDYQSLADKVEQLIKPKTVWDIIDEQVIKSGIKWENIHGDLKSLVGYRNKWAHHRIITNLDLNKFKIIVNRLKPQLDKAKPKSNVDVAYLRKLLARFVEDSSSTRATELYDIFSKYQASLVEPFVAQSKLAKALDTISRSHIENVKGFQEALKPLSPKQDTPEGRVVELKKPHK